MSALLATLSSKALKELWKLFLKEAEKTSKKQGEWEGVFHFESLGKSDGTGQYAKGVPIWRVTRDIANPCRLVLKDAGLEYTYYSESFITDFGSIPPLLGKIKQVRLGREDFRMSYALHDDAYNNGYAYVRPIGEDGWVKVPVDRRQADILLCIALTADTATNAELQLVYRGVRTFARSPWFEHRKHDGE